MKGVQPIVLSRKRRINGEKVESSVDHQRSPSQKPDRIDAGCTAIERMILEVQEEGRKLVTNDNDHPISAVFEILNDHNHRIEECERSNELLQQQFSDLSRLVNSSLLSENNHSSEIDVSRITVVHDELSTHHSLSSPPIFSDPTLPSYNHLAVENSHVSDWTSTRVEELITAMSISLQCWLREKEQLLLLKRMLIQSKCVEGDDAEKWYNDEVMILEEYYKQENNTIQYELKDIRKLLLCPENSEQSSDYIKPLSTKKRESELQMGSIPPLSISTSEEMSSRQTGESTRDRIQSINNSLLNDLIIHLDDILNAVDWSSDIPLQNSVMVAVQNAMEETEKNGSLIHIMTIALTNEIQNALNSLEISKNAEIPDHLSIIKNAILQSFSLIMNNQDSAVTKEISIPIHLARDCCKNRIIGYQNELKSNINIFIDNISNDILDDMITSEIY